jgi:hypothetical protein
VFGNDTVNGPSPMTFVSFLLREVWGSWDIFGDDTSDLCLSSVHCFLTPKGLHTTPNYKFDPQSHLQEPLYECL